MKKLIYLLIFIPLLVACKKNELGGKSTIKGKVAHHGKGIANATVYIKFDAEDFPGSDVSKYDAKVNADISGSYEIAKIYKGKYYLYAVGEDFSLTPPNNIVVGGIPVKVRQNEDLVADIPVTEGD